MKRRLLVGIAIIVAAGAALALRSALAGSAKPPRSTTAGEVVVTIASRDLRTTANEPATLGYDDPRTLALASDASSQQSLGIVTAAPSLGAVIRRGGTLLRIDERPLILFYGRVPAWRTLSSGVANGTDLRELEANLHALGFDRAATVRVDGHWTWATTAAVERWQRSLGEQATGAVGIGDVAFLPGPRRIAAVSAQVGAAASGPLLTTTGTTPVANVALDPADQASVRPGTPVDVGLPDGRALRGRVSSIGAFVAPANTNPSNVGSAPAGVASSTNATTIPVTVPLFAHGLRGLDGAPATATITTAVARHVLSVPVTALLALNGGGYGLELAGTRRLTVVEPTVYAGGFVQVSGRGVRAGLRVLAAGS